MIEVCRDDSRPTASEIPCDIHQKYLNFTTDPRCPMIKPAHAANSRVYFVQ